MAAMKDALLMRRTDRGRPQLELAPGLRLTKARVHEACGRARRIFALWLAAQTSGPVFWIAPSWGSDRLNPEGICDLVSPARFTFIAPRRPEDVLWTMEEVLRSGAVPLAVADIGGLPGLTAVRRMHLAAQTGTREGFGAPLGLLLTPGAGGAQGIESRWRMEPETRGWGLTRLRARTDPVKHWHLQRAARGFEPVPAERAAEKARV